MMKKYQAILLDLDGTVTDPGLGITNSVMYALEKFAIIENDRSKLYKFIGPPLADSFRDYYGFSKEQCELGIQYYREYFREKGIYENTLYDGMEEFLKEVKAQGIKILLATSKPEEFARIILDYFHLTQYFDIVGGASMDEKRNKKSDVIRYALDQAGIKDLSSAVMIGDREHDIFGAKENGLDSVGVLYGYGSQEEFEAAGADYIVADLKELKSILF